MQHLEVSCAVRPIKWPLVVKWLTLRNCPKLLFKEVKENVKLSHYRPEQAHRVPGG